MLIPYTPAQIPALLGVWGAATGGTLALSADLWRQQVAAHPLFTPGDCLILPAPDGDVAGFALVRQVTEATLAANPDMARYRGQGHLMALAVHPRYGRRGFGSRLLALAEARLRDGGATRLTTMGPPGHFVPGVPAAGGSLPFWRRHGYAGDQRAADLRRALDAWTPPPPPAAVAAGDFAYRQGQAGEQAAILGFVAATFPGDWRYTLAHMFALGYNPGDVTLLCDRAGAIQGFLCAFHPGSAVLGGGSLLPATMTPGVWGGMGPLGIAPGLRGGGLGLGLVAAGTDYLYRRGVRDCGIDWTTLLDFYGRLGYTVWREFLPLHKPITAG